MSHLSTPTESPLYEAERAVLGYVPNYLRVLAPRPEVYQAWLRLAEAVRAGMDLRRYELVTLTAARRLGSAYCGLAHAGVLRQRFYDDAALRAIVADHHDAGLAPVDVAVMDFADRVAADPTAVTERDIAVLRGHGLADDDILQIVLAVCLRRFFSGVLSAVGAVPDPVLRDLPPDIRAAVEVTGDEASPCRRGE
ncbi:carboxymuconolactone decarboxylase family protein [Microbispora sp. ATCC PTA-5024]|uniref:carboxymuconolactone decarboxylase family protein n=1 Tax=Microbispora sp. ATCC PTA-5024 TaxID=316330 RepID=UPI0003DCFF08|nr:carboxymuconolactone decarboxylase family protein [Microbispora sp. ATCC PTA-5024]ETK35528.1 carboxymuconolactone decarboxylase [Microbispora sp. ATCC PTA-5024]